MNMGKRHTLSGTRELLSDNIGAFEVRYYRAEKETEKGKIYGVYVEHYEDIRGAKTPGESCEQFLTTDREQIDKILDGLIGNSVTVCAVPEVLDCLYDETI